MGRKKKKEVPFQSRPDRKQVRIPAYSDAGKGRPSWRFSTVDKSGPFAWPVGQDTEMVVLGRLREFDGMEWSEIEGKQHHAIKIDQLSRQARNRLEDIGQDDIDELFSFRLQGEPRFFCIRDRHIAKLLWYDPKHLVCPSTKKHT